jgi:flagellar motility protein MotE (MotC chaperone)
MRVLIEVVNAMNPRRMADILAQMTPDVAERLTLEIANRSGAVDKTQTVVPADLPKIEGRPNKS